MASPMKFAFKIKCVSFSSKIRPHGVARKALHTTSLCPLRANSPTDEPSLKSAGSLDTQNGGGNTKPYSLLSLGSMPLSSTDKSSNISLIGKAKQDFSTKQIAKETKTLNSSNTNFLNNNNDDDGYGVMLNSLALLENAKQTPEDIIRQGNLLPATTAKKQVDTMKLYDELMNTKEFSHLQAKTIVNLLVETLDEQFYSTYNYKYVRNMELDNFGYLYDNLSNDLKFELAQLSNNHLMKRNIQILKLQEDLANITEELNQSVITELQKGSKVDFTNHKIENTLLHKDINMRLKQLDYKINTHLFGRLQSQTEQLRWYTMKNGLLALLALVSMVIVGANFNKFINTEKPPPSVVLKTVEKEEDGADEKNNVLGIIGGDSNNHDNELIPNEG